MAEDQEPHSASDVLDLAEHAGEGKRTSLGEIFDSLGAAIYGSVYLLVGVITLTPIGGLPGFSITSALIVILLGMQQLVGREHPWLPGRILRLSVSHRRLVKSLERVRPVTDRLERVIKPRLALFLAPPFRQLVTVEVMLLGAAMIPLAAVPFGADAPGTGLIILGLGLVAGDGLLIVISLLASAGTGWLIFAVFA